MTVSFATRLAAVRDRCGPLVLGADPHGPLLATWGLSDDADGLERFADIVLEAAARVIGIIKPQSAFFERHGWQRHPRADPAGREAWPGGRALVILDVKRGDVG